MHRAGEDIKSLGIIAKEIVSTVKNALDEDMPMFTYVFESQEDLNLYNLSGQWKPWRYLKFEVQK